jgi:hypothetical protein
VRRSLVALGLWAAAIPVAACADVAGLGNYELASSDASANDATRDGFAGDTGLEATESDDGGGSDGTVESGSDAGDAGDATDEEAAVTDAGAEGEAAADAHDDQPGVPPSDKGHVLCGADLCSLPLEDCCEQPDGSTCQSATASCTGGAVAKCDEAANCLLGQVCCVTDQGATGVTTECRQNCTGNGPQSCRTDQECGGAGPCEAWMCAGSLVATCGGAGEATGCH